MRRRSLLLGGVSALVAGRASASTIQTLGAASARALGFAKGSPLSASASPTSVSGTAHSGSSTTVTSGSTTVTPTGGTPPYTYAWTRSSGSFSITSPTAASTTFSESLGSNVSDSGAAVCTVTDADGQTATASVSVSLANSYNPPTWNINNGDNIGTWVHGGAFNFVSLYATSPSNQVVFSTVASGCGGVSPGWTDGVTYSNATASGFQFGGQVPGGTTPGTYSFTVSATNPAEGTGSTIAFYITVT